MGLFQNIYNYIAGCLRTLDNALENILIECRSSEACRQFCVKSDDCADACTVVNDVSTEASTAATVLISNIFLYNDC